MQRSKSALSKSKYKDERNKLAEDIGTKTFVLSDAQKTAKKIILNNRITFIEGYAGTGKSLVVLLTFCERLLRDSTAQLWIIRTPVQAGSDDIGALPDGKREKIEPHFESTKNLLIQILGAQRFQSLLDKKIHFDIPNFVLGRTFDNAMVLVDEAQQLRPDIMKLLLERIGKDSTFVVAGDKTQLYLDGKDKRNGMSDAINRFFTIDKNGVYQSKYSDEIAHYAFNLEDVQRDYIVKAVIKAYRGDTDEDTQQL